MLTTVHKLHLKSKRGGHTKVTAGKRKPVPKSRVPRVAKLMDLAIRLDELLQAGEVASRAELARLGKVSRGRLSQLMNLLNLAPDIQGGGPVPAGVCDWPCPADRRRPAADCERGELGTAKVGACAAG